MELRELENELHNACKSRAVHRIENAINAVMKSAADLEWFTGNGVKRAEVLLEQLRNGQNPRNTGFSDDSGSDS